VLVSSSLNTSLLRLSCQCRKFIRVQNLVNVSNIYFWFFFTKIFVAMPTEFSPDDFLLKLGFKIAELFHRCRYVMLVMQSIAISVSLCLFVCLFVCFPLTYLKIRMSKCHEIFCLCHLWLWLDPPLMTVRYVRYFRFCG